MPAGDLTLTIETDGDARVINVAGELDLSTVEGLEAKLEEAASAPCVVVMLGDCTFIDSSALRTLVRAERAVRERGGRFGVVAPSEPARRVLEVAALDRVIPVFDTVDSAVNSAA